MSFPKTKPPHNIRVLHGWLRAYAAEHGQAEGRLKRSVDHAIVLNALHGVRNAAGKSMFVVKGGVAIELRLRLDARATRDLDAVFLGGFEEWLDALDNAFEEPVADFELSRGEPVEIRTTKTMRVHVYLDYRGRRWGTVTLEVAPAEGREILDVDEVQAFDLAQFGLPAPETVPVVGLPYLIAQKLHACTEPFDGRDNPRVRDLVDLQLVRRLVRALTCRACATPAFRSSMRGTHMPGRRLWWRPHHGPPPTACWLRRMQRGSRATSTVRSSRSRSSSARSIAPGTEGGLG